MSEVTLHTCPACGAAVICDDARRTIHHVEPTCEMFTAKMRELGLARVAVEPTMFVSESKGPAS